MTIKRLCTMCGDTKPLTQFYADQLRYETTCKCKTCYNKLHPKRAQNVCAESVRSEHVNAFDWRRFVQPVGSRV
jgi:hypothetical protein